MRAEEPKHDLSSSWTGDDGGAYLPISLVVLLRRSIWISGAAYSKKPWTATARHSGWRNGFKQFQIWIHFVYRSHFLTASAVPRCLRAWSVATVNTLTWRKCTNKRRISTHVEISARKPSNRAPACNSQPVFICAEEEEEEGRGRQASQSASILRSFCVSTQRGARCVCGAVAGWLRHALPPPPPRVSTLTDMSTATELERGVSADDMLYSSRLSEGDLAAKAPSGSSQCPPRRGWCQHHAAVAGFRLEVEAEDFHGFWGQLLRTLVALKGPRTFTFLFF